MLGAGKEVQVGRVLRAMGEDTWREERRSVGRGEGL